jgi:hypothetical protein
MELESAWECPWESVLGLAAVSACLLVWVSGSESALGSELG